MACLARSLVRTVPHAERQHRPSACRGRFPHRPGGVGMVVRCSAQAPAPARPASVVGGPFRRRGTLPRARPGGVGRGPFRRRGTLPRARRAVWVRRPFRRRGTLPRARRGRCGWVDHSRRRGTLPRARRAVRDGGGVFVDTVCMPFPNSCAGITVMIGTHVGVSSNDGGHAAACPYIRTDITHQWFLLATCNPSPAR
jgi:hypothetical protein